jgi:hypothetical protein
MIGDIRGFGHFRGFGHLRGLVTSEVWSLARCGHFRGVVTSEVSSLPMCGHLGGMRCRHVKSLTPLIYCRAQSIDTSCGRSAVLPYPVYEVESSSSK